MSTIQHRIKYLDNENKARKTAHYTMGTLIKFIAQTSQEFSTQIAAEQARKLVRVKFIVNESNWGNGKALVVLKPELVLAPGTIDQFTKVRFYANEPQAGDGSIVCRFYIEGGGNADTTKFIIKSTGANSGTFVLL
jgi:hypothetical protein